MDAEQEEIRKKELESDLFRSNALLIINEMMKWESEHAAVLVDEILHSIFFLGKLNDREFSPERILRDDEMLNKLKDAYPEAFELYSSQLPKRSPLSCVLDMIVEQSGQENEKNIIDALRQIIRQLKKVKMGKKELKPLVSSTICVSQKNNIPNSVRYYGVSMSTSGRELGQIMIAASCLSSWDSYVAGAVMTYYPDYTKKSDFDGTIKLPEHVRCQAFNLGQGKELDPCRSCGNLFGLTTDSEKEWPYGHCAEAESLSKLLKNVKEVREQVQPTSETCTEKSRKKAEEDVLIKLRGLLRQVHFVWVNEEFYTPQRV